MLKQLEQGIYIPEYDTTIPWLIEESELKNYIPEENIFYSKCKWPFARFTLFGIDAYYYFNFISHFQNKLAGISFSNSKQSKEESANFFRLMLLKNLGPSNVFHNDRRWTTDTIILTNSLSQSSTIDGIKSTSHDFCIQYLDQAHIDNYKEKLRIKNKPFVEKAQKIVSKYSLCFSEYNTLSVLNMEGSIPRNKLAKLTERSCDGDRLGNFSLSKYQESIKSLIKKGWLKKISKKDRQLDKQKFEHENNQNLAALYYCVGDIDLTQKGYDLYNKVHNEIYDISGKPNNKGMSVYIYPESNCTSVLVSDNSMLENTLEELNTDSENFLCQHQKIETVSKPYKIKNWWFSRFKMVPKGWRIDITYSENHKA